MRGFILLEEDGFETRYEFDKGHVLDMSAMLDVRNGTRTFTFKVPFGLPVSFEEKEAKPILQIENQIKQLGEIK